MISLAAIVAVWLVLAVAGGLVLGPILGRLREEHEARSMALYERRREAMRRASGRRP